MYTPTKSAFSLLPSVAFLLRNKKITPAENSAGVNFSLHRSMKASISEEVFSCFNLVGSSFNNDRSLYGSNDTVSEAVLKYLPLRDDSSVS